MTTKQPDLTDLNTLAMEACDMWQEHLSNLANDPNARAELTRFLEPQRRMFSDWAAMMRQGGQNEPSRAAEKEEPVATPAPDAKEQQPATAPIPPTAAAPAAPAAPSSSVAHGDDPLRVAQLALRMAELEKRVSQLELQLALATR